MKRYKIDTADRREYPLGATRVAGGLHVSFVSKGTSCALLLFGRHGRRERIAFPESSRMGDVWSMTVLGEFEGMEYAFEEDGREVPDPFGRRFTGREKWGNPEHLEAPLRTPLDEEEFDWEGDEPPRIPWNESLIYRLHVRGFTKHPSSGLPLELRGTFAGIREKIPYIKELGMNAVELMIPVEFEEVMRSRAADSGVTAMIGSGRPASAVMAEASGTAAGEAVRLSTQVTEEIAVEAFDDTKAGGTEKVDGTPAGMAGAAAMTELSGISAETQAPISTRRRGRPAAPQVKPKLNYWGYGPALRFAPKASYAGRGADPARELRGLVKALHREGMELILELYFTGDEAPGYVLDVVRFWAREYHVDGVHLTGFAPLKMVAEDPYLSRLKLLAENWEGVNPGSVRHLAGYDQSFLFEMRGFLKGDEGKLGSLSHYTLRNPEHMAAVNFMANTNGFTMMDMVSYDVKHNEDNGENNEDGPDYNQSWNCGAEGPTRKRRVLRLREKQLKNAMLLLFLSQGTPLLLAGDELGRTKRGNNNTYCQDNEISWINWDLMKTNAALYRFTREAIAFRKVHPVLHMEKEAVRLDYRSLGLPDVSLHGTTAWRPDMDSYSRQLGIFYCGDYAKRADGASDDYLYVAYNMHWESHEFALPNLPKGLEWHVACNTGDEAAEGFFEPGSELKLEKPRLTLEPRSIVVFIGRRAGEAAPEKEKKVRRGRKPGPKGVKAGGRPKASAKLEGAAEPGSARKLKAVTEPKEARKPEVAAEPKSAAKPEAVAESKSTAKPENASVQSLPNAKEAANA